MFKRGSFLLFKSILDFLNSQTQHSFYNTVVYEHYLLVFLSFTFNFILVIIYYKFLFNVIILIFI